MSDIVDLRKESKNVKRAINNIIHARGVYDKLLVTEEKERFKYLLDVVLEKWNINENS